MKYCFWNFKILYVELPQYLQDVVVFEKVFIPFQERKLVWNTKSQAHKFSGRAAKLWNVLPDEAW